jgi:tRNA(fMet)-specific endonuclease VapC
MFQRTLEDLIQLRLLPFDDSAAAEFIRLKASVRQIGTQDLKIAAIVLSVGGVLVTRNQRDFARI